MSQGGTFKPRHEVFPSEDKFKLIVDKELQAQIAYLHNKHQNVEWCGMLFYDFEEGNMEDVSNLVVRAKRLYLIDVGTAGFTGGDLDEKLLDFYDEYPETMNMRMGFIHTHHGMSTFFSGTDMQELHDNTDKYNFYLSLIVNHTSVYCAKIATIGTGENTVKYTFPGDDGAEPIVNEFSKEVSGMFTFDAEIEFDVNDYFKERYDEVKPAQGYGFRSGNTYSYSQNSGYGQSGNYSGSQGTQGTLGFQTASQEKDGLINGSPTSERSTPSAQRSNTQILAEGSVEDDDIDLWKCTGPELYKMFGIDMTFVNKQSTLKKIYCMNPAAHNTKLIDLIINEKTEAYSSATPDEQEAILQATVNAVQPSIIKVFGLELLEDNVQEALISAIAEELAEALYKRLTVTEMYHDLSVAVTSKIDELAYLSQESLA